MDQARDAQSEHDGETWARVYIEALASPPDRSMTAGELAIYARALADRYMDFCRARRKAAAIHHSRMSGKPAARRWNNPRPGLD